MLLEMAIADAYGAGFEYADPLWVRAHNVLAGYVSNPRHRLRPGHYTDDTQMSLAVAEALLSGRQWNAELLAEYFVRAFHRDPREGYAKGFYSFLERTADGEQFLREVRPDSDKSGAAMRAGVLGLLPNLSEVLHKADVQARVTHDTPDGRGAAQAAAAMVHYCRYQLGPLPQIGQWVAAQVPGDWANPYSGKVDEKGWMAVRAALTALARATRLSELLRDCVDFTGDVDTVATIAFAAASVCPGLARDLPPVLYEQLEDGPFGRKYLEEVDERLMALAGAPGGDPGGGPGGGKQLSLPL